jgi:hypothetical protein
LRGSLGGGRRVLVPGLGLGLVVLLALGTGKVLLAAVLTAEASKLVVGLLKLLLGSGELLAKVGAGRLVVVGGDLLAGLVFGIDLLEGLFRLLRTIKGWLLSFLKALPNTSAKKGSGTALSSRQERPPSVLRAKRAASASTVA